MKTLLSALALLASISIAQAGPKEDASQVIERWSKAFVNADLDGIVTLYAPEATMIGTLGKVVMTKPEQIRKYFETAMLNSRPTDIALQSAETLVIDDNTVVLSGLDTITGTMKDGQPYTSLGRVTFVLAKRAPDWKILHLHRSPLPK
ncbi:nuclear transport factor 2 family protein [Bradyrhizobium arachidis]|uniref:nuclear transport factor 2 family protein n=1 Tax=Bradyrhizobium arachidis TaxID=858423 RepID=UPI002163166A|nr:nuclear transport factor 2 family protein [Bradyrhizobium arachidis]UVO34684.1 nuclear transport factor 2 family protein [Bradyrhizobium arachidis]